MFFILSKLLDLLVAPLTWALILVLLAILWGRRRPGLATALLWLAIVDLTVFSVGPVANSLFKRLESHATDTFRPGQPYDVVVVLGGVIEQEATHRSGELELDQTAERITRAASLLRNGEAKMALLSGGTSFPERGDPPEATLMARWLRDQGIAEDRLVLEGRSRNTRENAVESAHVIAQHGWKRVLLLTSAWHAPRALGCFRAVGLEPDLLTVDHRTVPAGSMGWTPRASTLSASTDALRELFGGVVYRIMGYAR